MPDQPELWEELKVETSWFHVVRSMITNNKIAEMGTTAWAIYTVVKAYTNFESGKSWPGYETIAHHTGVSTDTVARAIEKLVGLGLVEKRKVGRRNEYKLIETFPISKRESRSEVATVSDFYKPAGFQSLITQLKELAKTGEMPAGATFKITVNVINQGDNSSVHVGDVTVAGSEHSTGDRRSSDVVAEVMRDEIRRIQAAR